MTNPGKSTLARTQKSHALAPGCCQRHAITRTCVQHDIFTIQTQIQIQVNKQIHIQSKQQQVGSLEWSTHLICKNRQFLEIYWISSLCLWCLCETLQYSSVRLEPSGTYFGTLLTLLHIQLNWVIYFCGTLFTLLCAKSKLCGSFCGTLLTLCGGRVCQEGGLCTCPCGKRGGTSRLASTAGVMMMMMMMIK